MIVNEKFFLLLLSLEGECPVAMDDCRGVYILLQELSPINSPA